MYQTSTKPTILGALLKLGTRLLYSDIQGYLPFYPYVMSCDLRYQAFRLTSHAE